MHMDQIAWIIDQSGQPTPPLHSRDGKEVTGNFYKQIRNLSYLRDENAAAARRSFIKL